MTKEKWVYIHLRRAGRTLASYYDRMLAPSGITAAQYSLLCHLDQLGTASTSALAASMKLDRSTLVRNLKPLFGAGLVTDTAKKDARDRCLALTETGGRTLLYAEKLWKKAQRAVKDLIGEKKLKTLMKTLAKIETLKEETV